jgi:hypothetical protein
MPSCNFTSLKYLIESIPRVCCSVVDLFHCFVFRFHFVFQMPVRTTCFTIPAGSQILLDKTFNEFNYSIYKFETLNRIEALHFIKNSISWWFVHCLMTILKKVWESLLWVRLYWNRKSKILIDVKFQKKKIV